MTKRYSIVMVGPINTAEWLDEADTREEAEKKFDTLKPSVKSGHTLVIGETATGKWMKKHPE